MNSSGRSRFERAMKGQEIVSVMKNHGANVTRIILCVLGLVIVQGCATHQDHGSSKSWSQIGAEEERQERLDSFPDGYGLLP